MSATELKKLRRDMEKLTTRIHNLETQLLRFCKEEPAKPSILDMFDKHSLSPADIAKRLNNFKKHNATMLEEQLT